MAAFRSNLIRIACDLPKGNAVRRRLLAALRRDARVDPRQLRKLQDLTSETTGVLNQLIRDLTHTPEDVQVETADLDLRGCRGQKRFAYRALQRALSAKAPVEVVNPAYTSQECPSCGYISRSNRSGTSFSCRSCGRKAHADWVGASGVLRRSQDNDITCADRPNSVKATLRRRYLHRRSSPARSSAEPSPLGRSLTTRGLVQISTGTGSNLVPISP